MALKSSTTLRPHSLGHLAEHRASTGRAIRETSLFAGGATRPRSAVPSGTESSMWGRSAAADRGRVRQAGTASVARRNSGARGDEPSAPSKHRQLTAFFTSLPIVVSSAAVSFLSANEVGHMAPPSRFASSLKPNVAYLDLNLSALWK